MDDFDYLNGTLMEWVVLYEPKPDEHYTGNISDYTAWIQDEYLPRFEAAIYRNITDKMSGKLL